MFLLPSPRRQTKVTSGLRRFYFCHIGSQMLIEQSPEFLLTSCTLDLGAVEDTSFCRFLVCLSNDGEGESAQDAEQSSIRPSCSTDWPAQSSLNRGIWRRWTTSLPSLKTADPLCCEISPLRYRQHAWSRDGCKPLQHACAGAPGFFLTSKQGR